MYAASEVEAVEYNSIELKDNFSIYIFICRLLTMCRRDSLGHHTISWFPYPWSQFWKSNRYSYNNIRLLMPFLDSLQVRTFDDANTLNCPLRDSPHHQTFENPIFGQVQNLEEVVTWCICMSFIYWPPNFSPKFISMKNSSWPKAKRHSYASRDYLLQIILSIKTHE